MTKEKNIGKQPDLNIGLVGHIDHGKTTLLQRLSGVWASRHSEELKRGITIKLGYADSLIKKCDKCDKYVSTQKCDCGEEAIPKRYVSFVDAPGHEMLMATMLSGAAIVDAAILIIAANEKCPQPQTKEHLIALQAKGIKDIIIAQNKIDLVNKEEILENYKQIKEFVKDTVAQDAPIIPVSAQQGINIEFLFEEIIKIKTPVRDTKSNPLFLIARSFDINKPGTDVKNLLGGVFGGTLKQGVLKKGDKIEIRPGIMEEKQGKVNYKILKTTISALVSGKNHLDEAEPSGSLAISTLLDPFLTKGDSLAGSVLGLEGKLPDVVEEIKLEVDLFEKVVGTRKEMPVEPIKQNENLLLSINTSVTIGTVVEIKKNNLKLRLKLPVVAIKSSNVGIARNIEGKWRLIGYGLIN